MEVDKLVKSLVKAKQEFDAVVRDKQAYNYKYAPLETVLEATEPALLKNGLFVTQLLEGSGADVAVKTMVLHESGQSISSVISKPLGKVDAQTTGSMVTYLRRYAYLGILGLAQEDDDGSATVGKVKSVGRDKPETDPAKYVCDFGKFKGKTLDQIGQDECRSYLAFLGTDGKKLNFHAQELKDVATKYWAK